MNEESRPARRLSTIAGSGLAASAEAIGKTVAPRRWWDCPCEARVSLREPGCPFCGRRYRPEHEHGAAA